MVSGFGASFLAGCAKLGARPEAGPTSTLPKAATPAPNVRGLNIFGLDKVSG